MGIRQAVLRWDQDPLLKLVGLVISTTMPVCCAAVGLTWKLSQEAESIRNKLDNAAKDHDKLEARVDRLHQVQDLLVIKVARCCPTIGMTDCNSQLAGVP